MASTALPARYEREHNDRWVSLLSSFLVKMFCMNAPCQWLTAAEHIAVCCLSKQCTPPPFISAVYEKLNQNNIFIGIALFAYL